jgi:hypothetical protein
MDDALARLGPFRYRTIEEAEGHGDEGVRFSISEELAFARVWTLAEQFNKREYLDRDAPRAKHVLQKLERLENLASELGQELKSTDDMTRHLLQTAGTGIRFDEDEPARGGAKPRPDPLPVVRDGAISDGQLVDDLLLLSRYFAWVQATFRATGSMASADAPDKGGNTNLYRRLYRSARWWLVNEGWHTYDLFKPGEATGTEGGPFHLFLCAVFELATGEMPEENSKLTHLLKSLTKLNRRNAEIKTATWRLERERERLARGLETDIPEECWEARYTELNSEIRSLYLEGSDIWKRLHP